MTPEDEQISYLKLKLAQAEYQLAASQAQIAALREAAEDMLAGWKYIRSFHGDLYGVGWDRAQLSVEAAMAQPSDLSALSADRKATIERVNSLLQESNRKSASEWRNGYFAAIADFKSGLHEAAERAGKGEQI